MDTGNQLPGSDQQAARGRAGGAGWYVGAAVALLAIGVLGGVALVSNGSAPASQPIPAAATSAAGSANTAGSAGAANIAAPAAAASLAGQAGPAGQAAVLSSAGSPAGSAQAAAAQAAAPDPAARPAARRCVLVIRRLRAGGRQHAARVARRHCRRLIRRRTGLRLLGGMYGQFTFRTGSGTRTIAFERGIVVSRVGSSVVIRAADGTAETWQLVSDTVVRRGGTRTSRSALASSEPVFVAGPVVSGAQDIRLAVVRPVASGPAPANSPAGS